MICRSNYYAEIEYSILISKPLYKTPRRTSVEALSFIGLARRRIVTPGVVTDFLFKKLLTQLLSMYPYALLVKLLS